MPDAFKFELVSPERLLVSGEVEQVLVPGAEGAGPPRCLIEVVAPAGLLDAGQKEAAIQRLTQEMLGGWSAGDSIETRVRTWVVVREVPEGSWGVAGCVAPSAVILSGLRG